MFDTVAIKFISLSTTNTSGEEAQIYSSNDLLLNGTAGGNVGIGTSSPPAKLTVSAGGSDFIARFKSTDNKAYMSIVYVKRITSQTSGSFYHGTGAGTNQIFNLDGTSNTNPYFISWGISNLPQDVWCVSVGYIQANNDSNTSNGNWKGQGLYRLDTGERIYQGSAYKMGSAGATLSTGHRVFLYYSSDNTSKLQFARPGFYEVNGHHPTINELVNPGGYAYQGSTDNRTFAGDIISGGSSKAIKTFRRWYMDGNADFGINNASGSSVLLISGGGTPSTSTVTFEGKVSTSGASTDFHASASNLIVGNGSGNQGMTIFSGSSVGNYGSIYFADGRADGMEEYRGMITYEQNNEIMRFHTAGHSTPALKLDLSRNATFGGAQVNLLDSNVLRIGTGADLQLFHDGTDTYIQNWTGSWNFRNFQVDGNTVFAADNGAGGGNIADYFSLDGGSAVHDGTTFTELHTKWQDKSRVSLGSGKDLQLYHDGSNSYIKNLTGWLNMPISQNGVSIANADFSASIARFLLGGACELYHNGTKRIETTNTGVDVTGALGVTNINMTGILDISATYPRINLNDTNHEDDWSIINDDGSFKIYNVDDSVDSLKIDASNNTTLAGNLSISGASTPKISITDTTNSLLGRIRVGNTAMYIDVDSGEGVASTSMQLQVDAVTKLQLTESVSRFQGSNVSIRRDDATPVLNFERNDATIVSGNDLGQIQYKGADPSGWNEGARISVEADGTWDTDTFPSKIKFEVKAQNIGFE